MKVLGTAKIRRHSHSDGGPSVKPALQLNEVIFIAYYPADIKGRSIKKGLDWLLRPLQASLHGYAQYSGISTWFSWPIVYLYGRLLKGRILVTQLNTMANPGRAIRFQSIQMHLF